VNLPTKRLVPAHVVPAAAAVLNVKTTSADNTTASPATSADAVASAAVAAVVASQTYMKVSAYVSVSLFSAAYMCICSLIMMFKASNYSM